MRGTRVGFRGMIAGVAVSAALLAGCDSGSGPDPDPGAGDGSLALSALGQGPVTDRYTSELWVHGDFAYTGTWGQRSGLPGNVLNVWNVRGTGAISHVRGIPIAPDSVRTLGDVQVSDDGDLLVVATEPAPYGSLRIFDLADPGNPRFLAAYASANTRNGVHTAEVARVDGKLYAFLSVNPSASRLVIVDLSDPASPREVLVRTMGNPFIHDVFVRDGVLFTALWNGGLRIWDIGGGGTAGASPSNPIELGSVVTKGGQVHNAWWYHAPGGAKKYVFVGQENPVGGGVFGSRSAGDIHVVDVSDMTKPKEVAFFHLPDAGTHNFSMDEAKGILFAAYYNGGVRALDVRGDLASCTTAQRDADGRCDLGLMGREVAHWLTDTQPYVWGVQFVNGALFASDMLNGLYRLELEGLPR